MQDPLYKLPLLRNSHPAFVLLQDYLPGQHSNQELVDFLDSLSDLEDEPQNLLVPKGDEFIACLHFGSEGNGASSFRRIWDVRENLAHAWQTQLSEYRRLTKSSGCCGAPASPFESLLKHYGCSDVQKTTV